MAPRWRIAPNSIRQDLAVAALRFRASSETNAAYFTTQRLSVEWSTFTPRSAMISSRSRYETGYTKHTRKPGFSESFFPILPSTYPKTGPHFSGRWSIAEKEKHGVKDDIPGITRSLEINRRHVAPSNSFESAHYPILRASATKICDRTQFVPIQNLLDPTPIHQRSDLGPVRTKGVKNGHIFGLCIFG